jgi:hypothetical protein
VCRERQIGRIGGERFFSERAVCTINLRKLAATDSDRTRVVPATRASYHSGSEGHLRIGIVRNHLVSEMHGLTLPY